MLISVKLSTKDMNINKNTDNTYGIDTKKNRKKQRIYMSRHLKTQKKHCKNHLPSLTSRAAAQQSVQ